VFTGSSVFIPFSQKCIVVFRPFLPWLPNLNISPDLFRRFCKKKLQNQKHGNKWHESQGKKKSTFQARFIA